MQDPGILKPTQGGLGNAPTSPQSPPKPEEAPPQSQPSSEEHPSQPPAEIGQPPAPAGVPPPPPPPQEGQKAQEEAKPAEGAAPPTPPPESTHIVSGPGGSNKKKIIATIIGLVLLLVSIPAGVTLVQQRQETRSLAATKEDCNAHGGFREEQTDCDIKTGKKVKVFVCNNNYPHTRLPGSPTGESCDAGTVGPATQATSEPPAPGKIDPAADGPGGCCAPGLSPEQGGCRAWEACDILNGACAGNPGRSCRVLPGEGCSQPTECGPGNQCVNGKCQAQAPPPDRFTGCGSWDYSDDPTNTADPTCETDPNKNGFSCRKPDGRAVCCYRDGNCQEGIQPGPSGQPNCEPLGNGTVRLNTAVSGKLLEYSCPNQTSSTGACSENEKNRGTVTGPGTFSVENRGCGGHQIDIVGYCGSYSFEGSCAPEPAPAPAPQAVGEPSYTSQCLDIKFYDTSWNRITDPDTQIKSGDKVRFAVLGTTSEPGGLTGARFRVNGGDWQQTTTKNPSNEYYVEKTVSAGGLRVEAQVFNPTLGWR